MSLGFLNRSAFLSKIESYIKAKYYSQFYSESSKPLTFHLDNLIISIPTRFAREYVREDYEPITKKFFLNTIKERMVVIDVGAHIGFYSLIAAKKVGPFGLVHAIEPSLENVSFIEKNKILNHFQNIIVHPYAVGRQRETRVFHMTESSNSTSFYDHPYSTTASLTQVQAERLDDLVEGKVDVVKIDVEGAEIEVLEGMARILGENANLHLFVEWNPECLKRAGCEPLDLINCVRDYGFQHFKVYDDLSKRVRSLDEVILSVKSKTIPYFWYVIIHATKGVA